ncbi:shikimate kinase [Clostridia bacterium]|nr:shikimate kinase [Clostridia bacterium]
MDNIVLIGMPGSGKSTIGALLAKSLKWSFVDTDQLIFLQEQMSLEEILVKKGLAYFLKVENQVNAQLDVKQAVISPGGSVVYGKEAMEHYKKIAKLVYLSVSYDVLEKRVGSLKERGVAAKEGMSFQDIYQERRVLYEQYADITIEEQGRAVKEIATEIEHILIPGAI